MELNYQIPSVFYAFSVSYVEGLTSSRAPPAPATPSGNLGLCCRCPEVRKGVH
jgi:hypothetical protein